MGKFRDEIGRPYNRALHSLKTLSRKDDNNVPNGIRITSGANPETLSQKLCFITAADFPWIHLLVCH